MNKCGGMSSETIKRLIDSDLNGPYAAMIWIATARQFNSDEETWRFTGTMELYNSLIKLGFSPLYSTEMACGLASCGLSLDRM